jgi:hypothetical protein
VPTADIDGGVHNEQPLNLSIVEKLRLGREKSMI